MPHESVLRKGFANMSNVNFTFNLNGQLSNMWSHSSSGNTITSTTVAFTSPPSIVLSLYDPNMLSEPIPQNITYRTQRENNYLSAETTLTSGASVTNLTVQAISLQTIPDVLVIYARRRMADRTYLTSDVYKEMTNLSIDFNNRSIILSSATQADLYKMSVKNGLKMSYPQWKKYSGSVVIVKPEDLGLQLDEAPSVLKNTQLAVRASFTNRNSQTEVVQMYVWVVASSLLSVNSSGQWSEQTGYLSSQDVLNSSKHLMRGAEMRGSGWFSSLVDKVKSVAAPVWSGVKAVAPIIKTLAPQTAPVFGAVGLGRRRKGRGVVEDENEDESLKSYLEKR
jgi:hypothetical protein